MAKSGDNSKYGSKQLMTVHERYTSQTTRSLHIFSFNKPNHISTQTQSAIFSFNKPNHHYMPHKHTNTQSAIFSFNQTTTDTLTQSAAGNMNLFTASNN